MLKLNIKQIGLLKNLVYEIQAMEAGLEMDSAEPRWPGSKGHGFSACGTFIVVSDEFVRNYVLQRIASHYRTIADMGIELQR